ncbi:MAG: hypothetical protein ACTSYB_10425 [Candidatus Helarchaeota archaeon]
MSLPGLSVWNRIQAFICAFLAGLIFIISGITSLPVFGQKYLEFVQTYFTSLDPIAQATLAQILTIMMLIADFAGIIILVAAVLILVNKIRLARIILFFTVGVGVIGFAIPIFAGLFNGIASLEMAIDSISTKYAVAALLALLARVYVKKA